MNGWDRIRDGETYKVLETEYARDPFGWITGMRYKVVCPRGRHIAYATTLRGARRAIAREKTTNQKGLAWWERPIVEEVER